MSEKDVIRALLEKMSPTPPSQFAPEVFEEFFAGLTPEQVANGLAQAAALGIYPSQPELN